MKSIGIAYLLWFPLGILGVHRFYCGRVLTGLLWLLTGGLGGLGWIIDAFLIPGMVRASNAEAFADLYVRRRLGTAPDDAIASWEAPLAAPAVGGLEPQHRVIYCTRCGTAMQVRTDASGRRCGCPNCRAILVVPA